MAKVTTCKSGHLDLLDATATLLDILDQAALNGLATGIRNDMIVELPQKK